MKIKLIILSILIVSFSNCKRYNSSENSIEIEPEKTSISKKEVQEVLNLKVNLKNYGETGKYNLAIPSHYYAETTEYGEDSSGLNFGKLTTTTENLIYNIKIKSSLIEDELVTETITIIKEDNPNLILIKDLKDEVKGEPNFPKPFYYEDQNSIIYDDDIKIILLNYDVSIKSYIIYQAEVSHFAKISVQDKFNLAIHLLKNGKNLLNTNAKSEPFSTWQDYVINFPKAEINVFINQFANITKEVKVFLNKNERSNIDNQNYFLYRSNDAMDLEYLKFKDAVKSNNIAGFDLPDEIHDDFENIFLDYEVDFKYNLQQYENVDYFKIDDDYETNREKLICHFDYQNKSFYIINKKEDSVNKNFYITMLNYFAKHKTLETTTKI